GVRPGGRIPCGGNKTSASTKKPSWDASAYLAGLPPAAIGELPLAGHAVRQLADGTTLRIDAHASRVIPEVWALYQEALARFGPVPTLIEWDNNVPPLETLLKEARCAQALIADAENKETAHADAA